ncbi:Aminopeptidase YpdF (MP-, MA-, MS-, AP-, NP- specific) [Acidisarcina polymorpha]|uniref:Aminopeptidase YpdF (MP-, MA-, MS-, AP-, NP-specific) n=1 Tax=Acidisarcina polymorpha TaxID=2211140 RepID=A0A2Z5FUE9_9BACT|nr:M24 family metallopeptidase [Acidisarcina polymorpha]AXC10488.1 Aminopeptidase YpdF (MP-, MA-, MS-, AP-, NP- specific) [Acidisarcina polymorpha]
MDLEAIQSALRQAQLDGWLFYDHHHRDPIAYRILGLSESLHVTRRWYYLIPAQGEPKKLVHRIEQGRLDSLPGTKAVYSSWQELEQELEIMLKPCQKLAMQYSPRNAIMYVSMVDAGTIELLRGFGKTIVSSSDLVSHFEAVLSEERMASHYEAQRIIDQVLAEGFREIGRRVRPANGGAAGTTEYGMVQWLSEAMRRGGLVWENAPDVAVNENTADSHYAATESTTKPIRQGDFVLIDIWGRMDRPDSVFYDITWTGVIGRGPNAREQLVFETVRNARDAAISLIESAFASGRAIAGWEADDAARAVIRDAGFGEAFTHRTGHNIATDIHGNGAHLDNLETHDERLLLPFTCFSVEPGIYLPEFGVRSEIDMMTTADKAMVTGRIQTELLRI